MIQTAHGDPLISLASVLIGLPYGRTARILETLVPGWQARPGSSLKMRSPLHPSGSLPDVRRPHQSDTSRLFIYQVTWQGKLWLIAWHSFWTGITVEQEPRDAELWREIREVMNRKPPGVLEFIAVHPDLAA